MNAFRQGRPRRLALIASVAGVSALMVLSAGVGGAGAAGEATDAKGGGSATITMERDGRELFFDSPRTVAAGGSLKVKNLTNPASIGPHTFSLVKKGALPRTPDQIKNCGKQLKKICGEIIEWHEVDLDTGEVGVNPVEVGEQGWDRTGSLKRTGDSWVSEKKNETFKRDVAAPEGKNVHFICAVHPEMQDKIRVEG